MKVKENKLANPMGEIIIPVDDEVRYIYNEGAIK